LRCIGEFVRWGEGDGGFGETLESPACSHLANKLVFLEEVGVMRRTAGVGIALGEAYGIFLERTDVGCAIVEVSGQEEM
jgi:Tfp pilus assembly protein PilZ